MEGLKLKTILDAEYSISTKKIIKWLWTISKGIRSKALLNIVLGVLDVCLDFLFIWATKWAIDIATGKDDSPLIWSIGILIGVVVIQLLLVFSRTWINALLGVKSNNRMQLRTFSRIMNSVWKTSEEMHSGDATNRLITDSSSVVSVINDTIPSMVVLVIRLIGAFLFVYLMNPTIAVILVCIVPVFLLFSKLYIGTLRSRSREVRDMESRVQSIIQESIQNRLVLKTLEQCGGMVSRLSHTQHELKGKIVKKTKVSSISNLIVSIGFAMGYCVTFIWGVKNLQSGAITYGMMLAFIQLVGQIQGPFKALTSYIPTLVGAFTSAERLIELDDMPLEEQGEPVTFEGEVGIRGEKLSFSYEDGSRDILKGLSFDFKPGSVTAIVGETGCGKTTLLRLMLALLSPTSGQLELYTEDDGGRSVEISPRTRCNLVYVPQGNTLLSGTVRDNLLLGNPDATEAELKEILEIACGEFVFDKTDGLDFVCSEKGGGLSEGQAQRIAIARALLRTGKLVILDEATSALDKTTEERLIKNLMEYSQKCRKTVIVVTHRTNILSACSEIIDFDKRQDR